MSNIKKKDIGKYREVIELFDEKTGEVVRVIRFRKSIEFDKFLKDFKAMSYPGYGWRYKDKGKKKKKQLVKNGL